MAHAADGRLARLAAAAERDNSAEILESCTLRARAKVCAFVGGALARAGLDPARARALRLAPLPDPLPSSGEKELAASDDDGSAAIFAAKIGQLAQQYEDGHEPDLDRASLAELLAWSLTRATDAAERPVSGAA